MKKRTHQIGSLIAAATAALYLAGCSSEDDHDHDDHEGHDHAEHAEGESHEDHGSDGDQAGSGNEGHDHEGHEHGDIEAGPNGGRILHAVEPHLEFLVTEDRKVQIAAVDDENKAIPVGDVTVNVTGGDRSNPTRLAFEKSGDVLVSNAAFPEGNDFPVVVQIKPSPDAKSVIEKFNLNLTDCPTCDYKEYACICDHGDHDGHDHDGEK